MKIGDLGEFSFIERIKPGCLNRKSGIVSGIGDDCAVFQAGKGRAILLTTDMLIEDIHFRRHEIPPRLLGRKSLAASISDIAAMGGTPGEALISIGIPRNLEIDYLDHLYDGLKAIAAEYEINILGGDTVLSPDRLVVNIALTGEEDIEQVLYRDGAKPGDIIFLSGKVGSAAAGLDLLKSGREFEYRIALLESHFNPVPHVWSGRVIASSGLASSMIDISDGLAGDLGHICRDSGVGAAIELDNIPVSKELASYCSLHRLSIENFILYGGEDYVLLGTVPEDSSPALEDALKSQECEYYMIGRITEEKSIKLLYGDGRFRELERSGYDHFHK